MGSTVDVDDVALAWQGQPFGGERGGMKRTDDRSILSLNVRNITQHSKYHSTFEISKFQTYTFTNMTILQYKGRVKADGGHAWVRLRLMLRVRD